MSVEVIVFDKDGTLIDFDDFWVSVSEKVILDLLKITGRENISPKKILSAIGVENGKTDVDGVLCKGTYEEIGLSIYDVLKSNGYEGCSTDIVKYVLELYNKNAEYGKVTPTCNNLQETLEELKKQGIKLMVVTTDNPAITEMCLSELGILNLFDAIYTDDGKTPVKPDPKCIVDYCNYNSIDIKNVIMVGDTMTDVRFARNAGMSVVCVATDEKHKARVAPHADAVVDNVSYIIHLLKGAR